MKKVLILIIISLMIFGCTTTTPRGNTFNQSDKNCHYEFTPIYSFTNYGSSSFSASGVFVLGVGYASGSSNQNLEYLYYEDQDGGLILKRSSAATTIIHEEGNEAKRLVAENSWGIGCYDNDYTQIWVPVGTIRKEFNINWQS